MPTLSLVEWLLIAAAVVAVVLLLRWALGSRRHVEIAPPASTVSPTLSRVAPPAAPVLPVTDASSSLIPIVPPAGEIPTLSIAPAVGEPDDLLELKGVGPKLATLLNTLGVRRFDQIAAWSEDDIAEVDKHLGNFAGRIRRDRWVEQARLLATGEIAGFESRFGKLYNRPL
jgi:predicted flap endonuclease-1-like 5' DNA nuclease